MPFLPHKNFTFIEGDIRNQGDLANAINVEVIIHLAAKAGVRPSIDNPILYQDVNIGGTQCLLEFAKTQHIQQFIFASSSSVYGMNEHIPWKEEEKLLPISPYAATKLSGEMLGHVYSKLYGIRFLALRFFTVYGPGQRPDLAIHKFFKAILHEEPIPVYGDGLTSRDYTYVADTVKGIIAAIHYDQSDFEIINLGNHKPITLLDLIAAIERTCSKRASLEWLADQPGDVPHTFSDISKAAALLDYHPTTALKTGLQEFYKWYVNRFLNNKAPIIPADLPCHQ
jgi:UDP-glucuronate 4-epimerase